MMSWALRLSFFFLYCVDGIQFILYCIWGARKGAYWWNIPQKSSQPLWKHQIGDRGYHDRWIIFLSKAGLFTLHGSKNLNKLLQSISFEKASVNSILNKLNFQMIWNNFSRASSQTQGEHCIKDNDWEKTLYTSKFIDIDLGLEIQIKDCFKLDKTSGCLTLFGLRQIMRRQTKNGESSFWDISILLELTNQVGNYPPQSFEWRCYPLLSGVSCQIHLTFPQVP